jgi:hypothetical protein
MLTQVLPPGAAGKTRELADAFVAALAGMPPPQESRDHAAQALVSLAVQALMGSAATAYEDIPTTSLMKAAFGALGVQLGTIADPMDRSVAFQISLGAAAQGMQFGSQIHNTVGEA